MVGAQQGRGGLDHFIALDFLGADVEQADAGAAVLHRLEQHRAHDGELVQVMGFAVDVRAQVEHIGRAALHVRQDRADGRTVDVGHGLEHVARDRHQGAGVASRDAGAGLAVLDQFDRDAHRGILLAAQGHFDRIVHGHHFGGVAHHDTRIVCGMVLLEFSAHLVFQADEDQLGVRFVLEECERCRDRHRGAVISAHAVN